MKKMNGSKRKFMALLLAVAMVVTVVPGWVKPAEVKAATSVNESKILDINWGNIKKVGHQAAGSKYCSVFSLAYCRTLLDGKVANPYDYWISGEGAYWGRASYSSSWVSTKQDALKKLYNSINNGRPAIACVVPGAPDHFVAIVGYENVTDSNKLSEENFIMIDPYPYNEGEYCTRRLSYRYTMSKDKRGYFVVTTSSGSVSCSSSIKPFELKVSTSYDEKSLANESVQIKISLDKEVKIQDWGYFIGTSENAVKAIDGTNKDNRKDTKGYVKVGSNKATKSLSTTIKKIQKNDLSPNKKYYYKIVVKANNKWFQSGVGNFKTKNDPPQKTTLKLTSDKDIAVGGKVTLSWQEASNTKTYVVKMFNSSNSLVYEKTGIKDLGHTIPASKLKTPGTYTIKLYTANSTTATTLCIGTPKITIHKNIKVTFFDTIANKKIEEQKDIPYGGNVKEPKKPVQEGYTFQGWDRSLSNIKSNSDVVINTIYSTNKYTVKFVDGITKEVLSSKKVSYGMKLSEEDYPEANEHEFHDFTGWSEPSYVVKAETHTIEARYKWNSPYNLGTSIVSIARARSNSNKEATDGYNIVVKVQTEARETKTINGRIVVALKTKKGRLLIETESAAFVLYPSATEIKTKQIEIFVPLMELASETDVYVVNSFNSAGIISNVVKDTNMTLSANNDEWQYGKTIPSNAIATNSSLNYVTYDLKTEETKDSLATSLSGYSLKSSTWVKTGSGTIEYVKNWPSRIGNTAGVASKETQGSQYNKSTTVGAYLYNKYNKTPKSAGENATSKITASETLRGAIYYHWCCNRNNGNLNHCVTSTKKYADTTSGNKYYTFHAFYVGKDDDTKYSATKHYNTEFGKDLYIRSLTGAGADHRDKCTDSKYWTSRIPIYTQSWTQYTKKFTYTKTTTKSNQKAKTYPSDSSTTATPTTQNGVTLNGSTKTTVINKQQWYAYKTASEVVNEDMNSYDIEVCVAETPDQMNLYRDKDLTVYVYKYDQVADYTTEYIGTAQIDENGMIRIQNAQMREECSEKTGDFTIAVALPNETSALVVGVIEAPKPKYTVRFYDFDRETVVYEKTDVEQGDTVQTPDIELLTVPEGERFAGWDQSTVGVNSNLNVYPTSETITCVVTFVNWLDQSTEMKEIQYGEDISSYLPLISGNEEIDLSWDLSACDVETEVTNEDVLDENGSPTGEQRTVEHDIYVVKKNTVITTISTKKQYETRFLGLEYTKDNKEQLEDIIKRYSEISIDEDQEEITEEGEEDDVGEVDFVDEEVESCSDLLDAQKDDYVLIEDTEYEDRFNTPIEIEETPNIIFYGWRNLATGEMLEDTTVKENAVYYPVYIYEETVSAPYASVHTGEYTANQTVTLSCDTEGASIFYTTDGSNPSYSETAIKYTSPISLNKSCTLRFVAGKMGMNDSEIITELYAMNTPNNAVSYYIITIDLNGIFMDKDTCYQMLVSEGTRLNSIDGEEIYGYIYNGLYYDKNYTDPFGSDIVDESMTLFAKYTPKKYTATFYYDSDKTQKLREDTVNYSEAALPPTVVVPEGYIFLGWDSDEYLQMTENCDFVARIIPESQYATVSINRTKALTIMKGDSRGISVTITPEELTGTELIWESSNPRVADVDENGLVTGLGIGEADITVTVVDTGESATLRVYVTANAENSFRLGGNSYLDIDSNGYLRRIKAGANTVGEIKEQFVNDNNALKFFGIDGSELADTDKIGTGTVIRFMDEENVLDEMIVIMTGDFDGDGEIKNRDVSMLSQYLVDKKEADIYQMLAIDVNGDGIVNVRDAAMLSRYLVGKEVIR